MMSETFQVFNGAKLTTSPVVVERELTASIPENSPVGSFIAQVHTNSSGCRFALVGGAPFHVDEISGIITTVVPFDVNNASTYNLEIMVQLPPPSIQSIMSTVTVTIMDVNDHAPAFTDLPNRLSISEDTPVGSTVLAIKASDADRGENSRITYRLMNDRAAEFLSIDKNSGKITLRKTVDFEKIQRFYMEVEACDNGTPKLCSTADLPVLVEDVNDNSPEFPCPSVHTVLPLNSPPGTVVATVFAEDRDGGTAGRVYYALLDAITGFSIDRSTGLIKTTEKLQDKEYRIRVGAMDGNGVMSTNNATVNLLTGNSMPLKWIAGPDTIEMKGSTAASDVLATYETNPPSSIRTTSPLLSIDSQGRLTIASPIPIDIDRFHALLIARSGDVSVSKCVQIRVFRDSPAPAFPKKAISMKLARDSPLGMEILKVDPGTPSEFKTDCRWLRVDTNGVISIKELIDKSIDSVQCAVEAWDAIGRRDALKMHITLERTEEPLRLNATYNLHVNEGTRPGAVLTTLAADPIYVFGTTLHTPIGVFPDGTVYVKREILKGIADVITVPITATHRLRNNTYSTMVHVFIDDVNSHTPLCPARNQFRIRENARIGSTIGFLDAVDDDSGLNGVVGYRLLDSQDLLRVGTSTGMITSATVFDAETLSSIDFKYEVFDNGFPPNTAICNATVFIVDVNDNAPAFEQRFYTSKVDINTLSDNRTIAIVKAVDRDVDDKLTYRLLNYQHLFEINSSSGEISRKGRLRSDSRFNISIAATDSGRKRAETFLLVSTSTDNELHPVFDKQLEPFRIPSSTEIGAIVGRVRAVAGSHVIKYHITDHQFDIDSWGNVILTGELTPEGRHDIVVTASTPFQNATTLSKMVVTPDSPAGQSVFRIEENSAPKVITKLDDGYHLLLTIPPSTAFKVKERDLVLTSPLDSESSFSYQILVGNGSTTQLLSVEVLDVNDNDPICDVTTFVADSSPFVTRLNCTDPDPGDKLRLSYHVTSTAAKITKDGLLTVHLSGLVTPIFVEVSDGENETNKRTKTVLVHVIHGTVRDPGISFPSKEISMLMTSSQPVGTKLGRITAESGLALKYYVIGSSLIRVNEDTGVVSTRRPATGDETAAIVAVSSRGVASVKLNIELIEDQLVLTKRSFLFSPSSLSPGQSLGSIDIGRDDVTIDLSDPYFYIRGNELFLKKTLVINSGHFYNCSAHVWKGRVSTNIEIYVLPPSPRKSKTIRPANERLEFWVRENAPYGSVVGHVSNPDGYAPAAYSIIGNIGLSIDPQTGILKTETVFDHETQQLHNFKLRTTYASGEFTDRDAILLIDDENDNIPMFEHETYSVEVKEDIAIGEQILTLKWSDKDFNNAFHLSIVEGNEYGQFEVDHQGRITVSLPLDREQLSVHRLVVRISDGIAPYPYHTADCVVTVTLLDVNDNAPEFVSQSEFQVEENSHRMKVVGKVRAVDADECLNAQVSYRILPETLPWAEFIIDAVHGDIMVNKPLDYEQRQNFTFTVVAMDYGTPQLLSQQQITAYLVDINDHVPIIRSRDEVVDVEETTPRGTQIASFEVLDDDMNDDSIFEIEEGYGIFDVSPLSGQLFLATPLDFETQSEYNVTVSARNTDGGAKSYKSIIVHVIDKNDETPRFVGGSPVQFSVHENLPGPYPTVIGSTISEDLDSGLNGVVAYSIFKGNTSLFSINSATGELLVLAPLDREDRAEHLLTVQAIDSGSPRLAATSEIRIMVLDDNDNAPEFSQPYYIVHVRENSAIGEKVLQVHATDKDEGPNGVIRYSLLDESPFSIDRATGAIQIAGAVDRELFSEYQLRIRATDSGRYKQLSSVANLTIVIDDENDNSPMIRNKLLDIFVPNNIKIGEVVHVVDGMDSDEDSTLVYNISGPDARFFSINERGEILAKTSLEFKAYYSITVAVFDQSGLNTSASFTFYMDDYKKFPRWTATLNSTAVTENSLGEVFSFHAESPRNSSSSITYSILSGNDDSFSIDSLSGRLSISSGLDRERRSIYRLWLAATDSESPPKSSITSIDIVVEDENDDKPVFNKVMYSAEILENFDPQQLLCVSASDQDSGENARISYSIASGNVMDAFSIDAATGCLRTLRGLDRESISDYRLVVRAADRGSPPQSADAIVKVKILDEDDNAPKFSHLFHAEVHEDLEVGSPILLISATDPDGYENHTFSIDNEADTPFSIDTHTGQISLREPLDREKNSSYRLRVRVSDGTWAVQTGAAIDILDINDNAPLFEKNRYVFIVNKSQVNQSIGMVHAGDADEGANGVVHYRFQQDIRCLSIDVVSGHLRLLSLPDRAEITATVIAQDNGVQPMTSSAVVTVVFAPKRGDSCEIAVTEDTAKGDILGKVDEYCDCANDVNAIRQFVTDESHVKVDYEGNFMIVGDFPRDADVTTDLVCELQNGSALIRQLKLELTQANERALQFAEKIFHSTVAENLAEGDLVGVVSAADDIPLRILRNGTILLAGILDYESQKRYIFNVTVIDRGQPSRNASAQVVVDLLDVDDSAPRFEENELVFAVNSASDVICPPVFDDDTSSADLQFFTKSPNTITTAVHGCIKINNTVPPIIDWIVSDHNQSVIAKVKLLDMIPTAPVIWDKNVTVSENAVEGTIVAAYESTIFANQNEQLSVDANEVKVAGGRGVHSQQLAIYGKSKFGRVVRSSTLTVTSSRVAPSPVFAESNYSFNISAPTPSDTVIHDFRMTVPADCHLELVSGNYGKAFCMSKGGSLTVCGPLEKPSYSILAEVVCGNRTTSRSQISVTVNPQGIEDVALVGFVRENLPTAVIGQLPQDHERKFTYHIGDKRLRETFSLSADGVLTTLKPLKRSVRSVYSIPIVAQPRTGRLSSTRFIVFVDEDAAGRTTVQKVNATVLLTDTTAEFDLDDIALGSPPKCQAINNDQYSVTTECHVTIEQPIDNEALSASINNSTVEVMLKALRTRPELESSMLQLVIYASSSGLAQLLTELQQAYADLTFYPIAIDVVRHRSTLLLAIKDRNQNVIAANDSRDILRSYFQKDEFPHALVESLRTSLCANVTCANGGVCRQLVLWNGQSRTFSGPKSIWSIPEGMGVARCECAVGFTGKWCDDVKTCDDVTCPEGKCTAGGDCVLECEKTCKNGVCTAGVCECVPGFAGTDCSLKVFGKAMERKYKKTKGNAKKQSKPQKTACSELNCEGGVCHLEHGRPSCHCAGGYEAHDCSYGSHVASMTKGFITLTPTDQLQTELALNYSPLANQEFCNGSQSISIDFRTRKSHGVIVALSYEAEFAVIEVSRPGLSMIASGVAVELLSSVLQYPDPLTTPANIGEPDDSFSLLGATPHQVRGYLSRFSQMTPCVRRFEKCIACGNTVAEEYIARGADFVKEVMNCPSYLEKLTGLDQLQASVDSVHIEFSDDSDSVMSL
ncbi:hypothetical protein Y032_0021g405 [Ancylostoma ceylanicum]|uniref:Cadherin domain-containing protein n=2 Tax=Ancylostoma ceylanicum TaxID=53326 RepID=A0A016V0H3_9BILA|nr:hypothetical protein Y032_0021g405 [Ancylostoma ceylanicum]